MNAVTTIDVATIPRIKHAEAMQIAAEENRRFAAALRVLQPDDWTQQTDCARWDVKALAAHVIGSAAGQASPREFFRQVRTGKPIVKEIGAQYWWDGMNELQVRERQSRTTEELVAEWDEAAAKGLKARRAMPRPIARLPLLNLPAPVGRQPLAYLFDIGFTRDVWMHRVDLTQATATEFGADAAHDGRIIADIVAEWAGTHGKPFSLELTGPAGGRYVMGDGGEERSLDALEFTRILAERTHGDGILSHTLPL
jgi:uncharacterized protein (TIGR03083 family)